MAFYPGSADQPVDAVIAADLDGRYGSGSTPAFRDTAYCRLQNLDFTKYGRIPQIRLLVENTICKSVSEICLAEAVLAGLLPEDLNLTVGEDKISRGYFVPDIETPAKVFEDMATIKNLAFIETSAGQILCKDLSDRAPRATVTKDDLGAYVEEGETTPPIDDVTATVPDPSQDETRTLELQFINPLAPSDFDTDRTAYNYPYTQSVKTETSQINATLLPSEADSIIQRELQKHYYKSVPVAFALPHKFAYLDACDCIEVEIENELKLLRIEEKTGSAPGIYEISATSEDIFILSDTPEEFIWTGGLPVGIPANSVGTLLDIPALADAEDLTNGIYAAACARDLTSGVWSGAVLYRYIGTDWEPLANLKAAFMGVAVGALGDVPNGWNPGDVDTTNSLVVDFYGTATPTTVTDAQIADGANLYAAGDEVVAVRTWTRDNDFPNRWTGTNLLRRLKNTSPAASSSHQTGERVVFLDDAVKFIPLDASERGVERNWKFVTIGQRIEDAASITFAWGGANDYNRETSQPSIWQYSAATNTTVRIGVGNYTDAAKFRKIETATNSAMTGAVSYIEEAAIYPNNLLRNFTDIMKASESAPVTQYYRVSHSSNNSEFSPVSDVLPITFAGTGGTGGSGGTGGGGDDGDPVGGHSCFGGETLFAFYSGETISMKDLYEQRRVFIGKMARSFDESNNIGAGPLEEVMRYLVFEYLEVKFSTDLALMIVTRTHPFWDEFSRFTKIGELKKEMRVQEFRQNWRLSKIESITPREAPNGIYVYNARIGIYHTYFACDKAVHNKPIIVDIPS